METAKTHVFSEEMCRRLALVNSARRELLRMGYSIRGELLVAPTFELPVTIFLGTLTEKQSIALLERASGVRWRVTTDAEFRDVMFMGVRVVWGVADER